MTLEELKAYSTKCAEVQSTLKRDIDYINIGVATEEERVRKGWTDFTFQLEELIQYLPNVEDMRKYGIFGEQVYSLSGNIYNPFPRIMVRTYSNKKNCLELLYDKSVGDCISMLIEPNGERGSLVGTHSRSYSMSDIPIFAKYKEKFYSLAKECVADCNKALNNKLIEQNKKALDRVAELKEM